MAVDADRASDAGTPGAEDGVLHSDLSLRLLLDYTPGGMAVLDRDCRYVLANRRWLERLDSAHHDLTGVVFAPPFVGLADRWDDVRAACLAGAAEHASLDLLSVRGSLAPVRWSVRPWKLSPGRIGGLVVTFEESGASTGQTGQNEIMEESTQDARALQDGLARQAGPLASLVTSLLAARDKAQQADRSKAEFLANMSHELRSPLNAIIGFAEIIRDEMFGPIGQEQYKEYIADIHSSGTHLLNLINDILDLSKIEAGKQDLSESLVALHEVVGSCRRVIHARAEEARLTLVSDIPPDLPLLLADERKLKQVLINLLSNAVKFTPEGGTITTKAWIENGAFVVAISDTGIGIAPEDIEKAMAAFGQVDSDLNRRANGTGLGLPLVKSLIELHGGSFHLESTVGVGTTVTMRLPHSRVFADGAGQATAI